MNPGLKGVKVGDTVLIYQPLRFSDARISPATVTRVGRIYVEARIGPHGFPEKGTIAPSPFSANAWGERFMFRDRAALDQTLAEGEVEQRFLEVIRGFRLDRALTCEQKRTILRWVDEAEK